MSPSYRRLELMVWATLPSIIAILLMLLSLAPKHISGLNSFMPLLPLIPVFYWGMLHAREMPYWLVFALGLVTDAASGIPLGLTSLSYLFFLAMLHAQRKYIHKEVFLIKWGYFGALLLVTSCLSWLFMSMLHARIEELMPAFIQWFLTVAVYPLFHKGFDALYRHISERRWHILHGH